MEINNKALVVIDIQNDITKHYRDIISNINVAIEWATAEGMHIVYIKHNNITAGTRTFKPGSKGEELVPEMKVVSDNIFVKTKSNALTSEAFSAFSDRAFYISCRNLNQAAISRFGLRIRFSGGATAVLSE